MASSYQTIDDNGGTPIPGAVIENFSDGSFNIYVHGDLTKDIWEDVSGTISLVRGPAAGEGPAADGLGKAHHYTIPNAPTVSAAVTDLIALGDLPSGAVPTP